MANGTQNFLFASPGSRGSLGERHEAFGGYKSALALGVAGSGIAALLICAHWSVVLVGAAAVLALSAMESEALLLLVIFLIPLGWVLQFDAPVRSVPLAIRSLVVVGFFAGRLLGSKAHIGYVFRPAASKASLLFLCAAIIPTIIGNGGLTHDSSRPLYELITFVGFYFVILAWVDSPQRMRKVLWTLLISTLATSVFAVLQQLIGGYTSLWLYLNPQDEYPEPWAGRSTSFLSHPNTLACYLNLVLPFALACCLLARGKWKKLGWWTLGLGILALLSSQSVGGLVAFASILVLAIFTFAGSRKQKGTLLAGLVAAVSVLYLLKSILNPVHTTEMVGFDAFSRLLLWGIAWNSFIHSPVVGVGWGGFSGLYGSELTSFSAWMPAGVSEVHNIYLQLLAETGLVGATAFFWLVVHSWRQARIQLRRASDSIDSALAFGVLGGLLSVLVHGFVDVPFRPQPGTLFWVLLALLVASIRMRSRLNGEGLEPSEARAGENGRAE